MADDKELGPIEVEVKNENVTGAYRQLRKQMGREGFLYELKKRQYYSKPSEEKREKRERAKRRRQRKEREANQ